MSYREYPIYIIFACNDDGVIGKNNEIPWKLKTDLEFFKNATTNNIVIMGRATYESIGKPLPNRTNIVISSGCIDGVLNASSLEQAIKLAENIALSGPEQKPKKVYIIGGKKLIEESIPYADAVFRTLVHKHVDIDENTVIVSREFENHMRLVSHIPNDEDGIEYSIDMFARY